MYLDDQSLGKQNEVVPPRKKISKGYYYEHKKIFFFCSSRDQPETEEGAIYIYYNEFNITFLKNLFVSLIVKGF